MNKTLAIHIEEDYLIAGVEPLTGKFYNLTKRGAEKFYFYFYVDKINNKIDYSLVYQQKFQDKIENHYGNLLSGIEKSTFVLNVYENEYVELLNPIISDVREMYFTIMRSLLTKNEIEDLLKIPLTLSYSASVTKEVQTALESFFLREQFDLIATTSDFSLLISKEYFHKKQIDLKDKKVAFIEALGTDLNMSVVNIYNKFESEISVNKAFLNFGLDPRTFILAKKIVDDINKQEGLLSRDKALKAEYLRHLSLSKKLLDKLETQSSPYLRVETNFAIEKNRKKTINISIDELNQLTFSHIRQISRYFETHFLAQNNLSVNDFDKIILIGDTLCTTVVKNEFVRFGRNKLEFLSSSEISLSLRRLLHAEQENSEKTNPDFKSQKENWKELEFLNLENLTIGQSVKLTNFDSRLGKGESIQKFSYLGKNQFVVLSSTRSLQKGDMAEALTEIWLAGMQIELKVTVNNKLKGVFKTRKIVKIEVA